MPSRKRSFSSKDPQAVLEFMDDLSSDGSCSEYEDEFDMDEVSMFADEAVGGDGSELFLPPQPLVTSEHRPGKMNNIIIFK